MARQLDQGYFWKIDRWNGGESEDSRIGGPGAFRYGVGWDIRSDSGKLQVAKKPVSVFLTNDEIKWLEGHPTNGDVYAYGGSTIYKYSAATVTTYQIDNAGFPNGQGLRDFNEHLYYRQKDRIGRLKYSTGVYNDNFASGFEPEEGYTKLFPYKNLLLCANGRYLATIDDLDAVNLTRLTFPPGYKVRDIFEAAGFAVILLMRGENIEDSESGLMVFWDGTKETYNDYFPITGNPQAGCADNNKIIIFAGAEPVIQHSFGGAAENQMTIPDVGIGKTALISPGAVDIWRGMAHFGISGGTSDTVLRLIRNWGHRKSGFTDVLNPEFPMPSTPLKGTTVKVTALRRIGNTLYFAWVNGSTKSVGYIDTTQLQESATFRTLAFDRTSPYEKIAYKLMVELAGALAAGETVRAKIGTDPYGDPDFEDTTTYEQATSSTVGEKILELPLEVSDVSIRSRDLHVELYSAGSGTTRPAIKRVWTALIEEQDQM